MQTALTITLVCVGVYLCGVVAIVVLARAPLFRRWSVVAQRRPNEALQEEVRLAMPFLFADFGGVFLAPDQRKYPAIFDYAVAIVGIDTIQLRFIRGRGQYSAEESYPREDSAWFDLCEVMAVLSPGEAILPSEADTWRIEDPLKKFLPVLLERNTHPLINQRCPPNN